MDKVETYLYKVAPGETVTFRITPVGTGGMVTAAQNGQPVPDTGTAGEPKFEFTVTEAPGNSHFAKLEFSFPAAGDANARYDITIGGSQGGDFNVTPVRKSSANKDPTFEFQVVQG